MTAWLKQNHFKFERVSRSRDPIGFSGTAAQVDRAFGAALHTFDVDGETHFANTEEPSIPEHLAAFVSGVRGLNDFRLHAALRHSPSPPMRVNGKGTALASTGR